MTAFVDFDVKITRMIEKKKYENKKYIINTILKYKLIINTIFSAQK